MITGQLANVLCVRKISCVQGTMQAQWPCLQIEQFGFEPWLGALCCVVSQLRHLTLTVALSTQVYKWVLANIMLGVTLKCAIIPSSGGVEILLQLKLLNFSKT